MSRRQGLLISALATIAIAIVLLALDGRMMDAGGPGIVGFEFAGSEHRAAEILAEWGDQGIDAAKASLWIDYAFIAAYCTFLVLAVAATRDAARERGSDRMTVWGGAVIGFAIGVAAFDAIEDVGLLLAVNGDGGGFAPRLGQICASLKFALLALTIGYLLAGLLTRRRTRRA